MYITIGKRTYRVYGTEGNYYIRRYKLNKQPVKVDSSKFFEKKPVKVTRKIKQSDQRLRDHIKMLEETIASLKQNTSKVPQAPMKHSISQALQLTQQRQRGQRGQPVEGQTAQLAQIERMEQRHREVQSELEDQLEHLKRELQQVELANGRLVTKDNVSKAQLAKYEKDLEEMNVAFERTTDNIADELARCHQASEVIQRDLQECQVSRDTLSRRLGIVTSRATERDLEMNALRDEVELLESYIQRYETTKNQLTKKMREYDELLQAHDELEGAYERTYTSLLDCNTGRRRHHNGVNGD